MSQNKYGRVQKCRIFCAVLIVLTCSGCSADTTKRLKAAGDAMQRNGQQSDWGDSHTVYDASECTGPVINGICHGGIVPHSAAHPVCHGEMLNGQCTGPLF